MSDIDIAIQNRKFAKTCVEKKRRDRINRCLDELKDLMSQSDDKARYQKMEKAEILEMAVSYMKNLRTNTSNADSPFSHCNTDYYTMAYHQCMNEFQEYLSTCPIINDDTKVSMMNYVSTRFIQQQQQQQTQVSNEDEFLTKKMKRSRQSMPYNNSSIPTKVKKQKLKKVENQMNEMSLDNQNSFLSSSMSPSSPSTSINYLYHHQNTFGGSNSSLDIQSNNNHSIKESTSSTSSSTLSSPTTSTCSSPIMNSKSLRINNNNQMNLAQTMLEIYQQNMWRPW
jgi:hypothetical protein